MPSEKADTARQQALKTTMSSVGQIEMDRCPMKASVEFCCPFSDEFHTKDSPATLDKADINLFHTTRTYMMYVPLTEHMGYPAETSTKAVCLISDGSRAIEPPITLGKAKTEGDRALKGLMLSNYVLSSPRVGIKEFGVSWR